MNLSDFCKQCHEANFRWWLSPDKKCTDCAGNGSMLSVDSPGLQGLKFDVIECPTCRGTGYYFNADRNVGEMLMLVVSEVSEAMEGHRKSLKDDKLPQYEQIDVELIDASIRIYDLLGARMESHGIDPQAIYDAKMSFNASRKDHTFEARMAEGGKKY